LYLVIPRSPEELADEELDFLSAEGLSARRTAPDR